MFYILTISTNNYILKAFINNFKKTNKINKTMYCYDPRVILVFKQ